MGGKGVCACRRWGVREQTADLGYTIPGYIAVHSDRLSIRADRRKVVIGR